MARRSATTISRRSSRAYNKNNRSSTRSVKNLLEATRGSNGNRRIRATLEEAREYAWVF